MKSNVKRVQYKPYYFWSDTGKIITAIEALHKTDDYRHSVGNYFEREEDVKPFEPCAFCNEDVETDYLAEKINKGLDEAYKEEPALRMSLKKDTVVSFEAKEDGEFILLDTPIVNMTVDCTKNKKTN